MSLFDAERDRQAFPFLRERSYFASCSLGLCPVDMRADLDAYLLSLERRSRALPEWIARWQAMHGLIERLIEAPPGSVFLSDSATATQASLASIIEPKGDRRKILIAGGDFPSSRYLWQAQRQRGYEIVDIDEADGCARTTLERIVSAIDERVRIVALSLVSPRTGRLLDTALIARAARRAGAIFIVDAYQALGIVPLRVQSLGAQVVVGGFHKWVGGGSMGLAFGYVEPSFCAALDPIYPGWLGHRDPFGFHAHFEPASHALKFQRGAPAMEPVYTSRAGIQWVIDKGIDALRAQSVRLTERLLSQSMELGLQITTPHRDVERGGMLCVKVAGAYACVEALATQGIDVDARSDDEVRIAPHPCTRIEECDAVIGALRAWRKGASLKR